MEKLCLSSTQSPTMSRPFIHHFPLSSRVRKRVFFPPINPKKFSVFSSKNDPNCNNNNELNEWDLMEFKFGKMIGEDPKLTLAKIKGRKMNPDASFLQIEKDFYRNKGKIAEVKEVPFDVPEKLGSEKVANGLKLVKPVPKKGIKVGGGEDSPKLPEVKRPSVLFSSRISAAKPSSVPNVILRKPSVYDEKDEENDDSSRLRIKPNLSLPMRTEPVKERFGGMTLLKKPQSNLAEEGDEGKLENKVMDALKQGGLTIKTADDCEGEKENETQSSDASSSEVTLLDKPNAILSRNSEGDATNSKFNETAGMEEDQVENSAEPETSLVSKEEQQKEGFLTGMQHLEQTEARFSEKEVGLNRPATLNTTLSELSTESVVLERPKRLDQSKIGIANSNCEEKVYAYAERTDGREEKSQSFEGNEETDWTRLEQRFKFGDRVDVELISCSPRGFVVSFGSLIGFLPYRNLAAKWKFLAFESWLRNNGLDPSKYRQNLGVIKTDEGLSPASLESSLLSKVNEKTELKVTADMELEDLLRIYDQEKIQYLSSYVGQHIRVNILLADRKSRKLIFSMRPKEKEEIVEKKRTLMAKLSVGDVVKCCIKKITYFGIFVEVEGVPALVHQTEVSWDVTLDPALYLKVGQVVEAKVHQLDFASERIFLSLKEITPDPLNEALECIVGNCTFNGGLEASKADSEWPEVDSLIKELQEIDGIQTVTKGRFFRSPGLTPTFQVYMASMFENQYKLLARSGNKVQEVMVQTSLDKEEMKSATLECTNRVQL